MENVVLPPRSVELWYVVSRFSMQDKYSLLMHRIKINSPPIFFMEWIKRFCGWTYHFSISLALVVLQGQKSLPDIGGTTIRCHGRRHVAWRPRHERWVILQILCNIFIAFKWILMMTWGQNISHYTTAKLSVHVWNHDLIWWQNKIDTQKYFHKTTITSSWTLSKTKIPTIIVKTQLPSNPIQKFRTRDNNGVIQLSLSLMRSIDHNVLTHSWDPIY